MVDKRLRYFDGQFLQDQDFIDQQSYHLDRGQGSPSHNQKIPISSVTSVKSIISVIN